MSNLRYVPLSKDIINIISKYLLPSEESIKKLKESIDDELNNDFIVAIKTCLDRKLIFFAGTGIRRCDNFKNVKYEYINEKGIFFSKPYWSLRLIY